MRSDVFVVGLGPAGGVAARRGLDVSTEHAVFVPES